MTRPVRFFRVLLAFALTVALLGITFHRHQHEDLSSKRVCPVCVTATHLKGMVEEGFQEFLVPLVSFSTVVEHKIPKPTDRIARLFTRSPPSF